MGHTDLNVHLVEDDMHSDRTVTVVLADGTVVDNAHPLPATVTDAVIKAPDSLDRNLVQPTDDSYHALVTKNHSPTQSANPYEHRLSDGTVATLLAPNGTFSSPGPDGQSEHFGAGSTVGGTGSIAVGYLASTVHHDGNAIGRQATCSGFRTIAIGAQAKAVTDDSLSIGYQSEASTGQWATAVGNGAEAKGSDATAFGFGCHVTGDDSLGVGADLNVTADDAVSVGCDSTVSAAGAIAIGQGATASHAGAIAIGHGVSSAAANEVRFPAGSLLALFGGTAAGPQTGGAATAAGTYGAGEQTMLQKLYDMARVFGFLT